MAKNGSGDSEGAPVSTFVDKPEIGLAMWIQNKSGAQFRRSRIEYVVVLGSLKALAYLLCSLSGQCYFHWHLHYRYYLILEYLTAGTVLTIPVIAVMSQH